MSAGMIDGGYGNVDVINELLAGARDRAQRAYPDMGFGGGDRCISAGLSSPSNKVEFEVGGSINEEFQGVLGRYETLTLARIAAMAFIINGSRYDQSGSMPKDELNMRMGRAGALAAKGDGNAAWAALLEGRLLIHRPENRAKQWLEEWKKSEWLPPGKLARA